MTLEFPTVEPDSDEEDQSSYSDYSAIPQVKLAVYGGDKDGDIPYGNMFVDAVKWEELKALKEPLNDRIVECSLIESNTWKFLRFRDDKREGNHISTVESVMESIQDKVSEEDLIRASAAIRDGWKRREAIAKSATNGQMVQAQNSAAGLKRKFEGNDETVK